MSCNKIINKFKICVLKTITPILQAYYNTIDYCTLKKNEFINIFN